LHPMSAAIKNQLLELGRSGCQGNVRDFMVWLENDSIDVHQLNAALQELKEQGLFALHSDFPDEYYYIGERFFAPIQTYSVSGRLSSSPLQLVRSRLEAFLRYHHVREELVIDISIAATEAMENAVKYSDHKKIDVRYEIHEGNFRIKIVNRMGEVSPEKDIATGKYSGTATLMRGIMIMTRLLDEMDIEIEEGQGLAVFTGMRKL